MKSIQAQKHPVITQYDWSQKIHTVHTKTYTHNLRPTHSHTNSAIHWRDWFRSLSKDSRASPLFANKTAWGNHEHGTGACNADVILMLFCGTRYKNTNQYIFVVANGDYTIGKMCPILSAHFACIAWINLTFVAFHLQPQLRLQRMHFECSIVAVLNVLNTPHTSTTTTTISSGCAYVFFASINWISEKSTDLFTCMVVDWWLLQQHQTCWHFYKSNAWCNHCVYNQLLRKSCPFHGAHHGEEEQNVNKTIKLTSSSSWSATEILTNKFEHWTLHINGIRCKLSLLITI